MFVPPLRVNATTSSQERNVFHFTGNWGNRLLKQTNKREKNPITKTKNSGSLLGNSTEPIVMLFQPSKNLSE